MMGEEVYFVIIHVKRSFEMVLISTLMIMTIMMIMMIIMIMIVIIFMITSFVKVPLAGQRSQPQWG